MQREFAFFSCCVDRTRGGAHHNLLAAYKNEMRIPLSFPGTVFFSFRIRFISLMSAEVAHFMVESKAIESTI